MTMQQEYQDNEEVLAAFRDWWSQFRGPVVTDATIDDGINSVRKFATYIEPCPLAESTIAELNAYRRELSRRGVNGDQIGMEYFRSFRESSKPKGVKIRGWKPKLRPQA
jgi:hypothetical protein